MSTELSLTAPTALREGVLHYGGRAHDNEVRDITVQRFMQRYHVDGNPANLSANSLPYLLNN